MAFDEYGGTGATTATFNVSEAPVVSAGGNAVVQQAVAFTRTGSFTDVPGDGPWTATVRYGDGTGLHTLALNPNMTFTLSDTYALAGTYLTTVTVTNQYGLTGTATFDVTVTGITVSAGANAVVQQGTAFTRSGSFTDPSADGPWTATVKYGDGTGLNPLALNANQTFTLSHTYANAGTFLTTVTVTNAAGLSGVATFDVTVSGFTVNDGSPQDSMVKSLTYVFPSPTQVEPGAFELLRDGKPSHVQLIVTPQPGEMEYLITFAGPGVIGGSVPDGKYTLITLYKKVHVLSGPPITSNDVNTFDRLFGDVNGDGVVNSLDKADLLEAEANPASPYVPDFEYDGKPGIDKTDIAEFDKRYKGKIDPPTRAPAKFRGRTIRHRSRQPAGMISATPDGGSARSDRPGAPERRCDDGIQPGRLTFPVFLPPSALPACQSPISHRRDGRVIAFGTSLPPRCCWSVPVEGGCADGCFSLWDWVSGTPGCLELLRNNYSAGAVRRLDVPKRKNHLS